MFLLVDGIYPRLSRFVKTYDQATDHRSQQFCGWQESARKDVERAFGVIQRKFQVLRRPLEQWYLDDIGGIVTTCIIFHNMMVEHRIAQDEIDDGNMYAPHPSTNMRGRNDELIEYEDDDVEMDDEQRTTQYDETVWYPRLQQESFRRWDEIHDRNRFYALREAIAGKLDRRRQWCDAGVLDDSE